MQRGGTLLELLFVIGLMAAMSLAANHYMTSFHDRAYVRMVAMQLRQDVVAAQSLASLTRQASMVCSINGCDIPIWSNGWQRSDTDSNAIAISTIDKPIAITKNASSYLRFDADGVLSQSLGTTFLLCKGHSGARVVVNRFGRTRIEYSSCA